MNVLVLLLLGTLSATAAAESQQAVVIVPVADVWSRPIAPGEKPADELRETQVLFGEKVLIHESSGAWVRIEAIEQSEFTHHNMWEGYPGWTLEQNVGVFIQKKGTRDGILEFASDFTGRPYLWGGMGDGMDCSGLVHLAYRFNGYRIPRDSHEQWMKANPIKRAQLKPADLIFSAKADNPKKITHVALYADGGQIIEAPQTGMVVREVSFKEKYGKALDEVESGDKVGNRVIYFGSFLQ